MAGGWGSFSFLLCSVSALVHWYLLAKQWEPHWWCESALALSKIFQKAGKASSHLQQKRYRLRFYCEVYILTCNQPHMPCFFSRLTCKHFSRLLVTIWKQKRQSNFTWITLGKLLPDYQCMLCGLRCVKYTERATAKLQSQAIQRLTWNCIIGLLSAYLLWCSLVIYCYILFIFSLSVLRTL